LGFLSAGRTSFGREAGFERFGERGGLETSILKFGFYLRRKGKRRTKVGRRISFAVGLDGENYVEDEDAPPS
jgi:hypothetical protein